MLDKGPGLPRISNINLLREEAYRIIKNAILNLTLKPGQELRESELARELGISKTPIREALLQLQREGFVVAIPFKGAFVSEIDEKEVAEIYQLRELLEVPAAQAAALEFTPEQLAQARGYIREMQEAAAKGDYEGCSRLVKSIHRLIAGSLNNQKVIGILENLDEHIERVRRAALTEGVMIFVEDYERILEAIEKKDAKAAAQAMKEHLDNVIARFRRVKGHESGKAGFNSVGDQG